MNCYYNASKNYPPNKRKMERKNEREKTLSNIMKNVICGECNRKKTSMEEIIAIVFTTTTETNLNI